MWFIFSFEGHLEIIYKIFSFRDFLFSFLLLIYSCSTVFIGHILYDFIYLQVVETCLWSSIWSILINVLCILESNACFVTNSFTVLFYIYQLVLKYHLCFLDLFLTDIFVVYISVIKRGMLIFPAMRIKLSCL